MTLHRSIREHSTERSIPHVSIIYRVSDGVYSRAGAAVVVECVTVWRMTDWMARYARLGKSSPSGVWCGVVCGVWCGVVCVVWLIALLLSHVICGRDAFT